MQLPIQSFSALVAQMIAAVQGSAATLTEFSVGSVLRALVEACAGVALWLQWLILQVLSSTRAATCQGTQLDSWMADFSFPRLPATSATATLNFSRYTTGVGAVVPVGASVLTLDGTTTFSVSADATNPAWNGSSGYILAPTASSVSVPCTALVSGSAGNIAAGMIGIIASPIAGVDTVTNPLPATGGVDAEADSAYRQRFVGYINSRTLATDQAIASAVAEIQTGIRYAIQENVDAQGNTKPGSFCVYVDDGSGDPPSSLIAKCQAAVEAVRPIATSYAVLGPVKLYVSVTTSFTGGNAQAQPSLASQAETQIAQWITTLGFGETLAVSKIDAIVHGLDASIVSVSGTLLNGMAADLSAPPNAVFVLQNVTAN